MRAMNDPIPSTDLTETLRVDLRLLRKAFTLQACVNLPLQGVSVLWGASGSGKTTLLRSLAGLERAQRQDKLQRQSADFGAQASALFQQLKPSVAILGNAFFAVDEQHRHE